MSELNFSAEQLHETINRIAFGHQGEMVLAAKDTRDRRKMTEAIMDLMPNTLIQPISVASTALFAHMRQGDYGTIFELVKMWAEEEGVPLVELDGMSPCAVVEHYVQQLAIGFSMIIEELVRQAREQGCELAFPLASIMAYRRDGVTLNANGRVGAWLPTHPFPSSGGDDGKGDPPPDDFVPAGK